MPRVRLKINSWDRKILIGDEAKVLLRAESWRGSFRVSMETVFPISSVSLLLLLSLSIYLHAHTLPLSLLSPSVPFLPPSLPVSLYLLPPLPVFLSSLSLSRAWGFHTVSAATLVSTDAPPPGGAPRARPTTPLETDLTLLRHYPSFPYYAVSYYRYYYYYYYCRAPFDS